MIADVRIPTHSISDMYQLVDVGRLVRIAVALTSLASAALALGVWTRLRLRWETLLLLVVAGGTTLGTAFASPAPEYTSAPRGATDYVHQYSVGAALIASAVLWVLLWRHLRSRPAWRPVAWTTLLMDVVFVGAWLYRFSVQNGGVAERVGTGTEILWGALFGAALALAGGRADRSRSA